MNVLKAVGTVEEFVYPLYTSADSVNLLNPSGSFTFHQI